MKRLVIVFVAMLGLAACTAKPDQSIAPEALSREQRLVVLQNITRDCGLPNSALLLIGEDELHIQPPPDASFESVGCALRKVRETGIRFNMGFVGNEAPAAGDGNAQAH